MVTSSDQLVQNIITYVISPFVYLLLTIAAIIFIWGVIKYIYNADEPAKREEGKKHILYGVIGLVIMVGAWGIIQLIANTFASITGT